MKGTVIDIPLAGMDQRLYPEFGGALEIVNMVLTEGAWRHAPGTLLLVETASPVVSMGWFATHAGIGQMLVEFGEAGTPGVLGYVHWPTQTVVEITDDRRILDVPGTRTTYLQNGNWCYVWSPYNAAIRWNGRRYVPVGFDHAPPAPTVSPLFGLLIDNAYGAQPFAATVGTSNEQQRGVGERTEIVTAAEYSFQYGYRVQWGNDLGQWSPPSKITWCQFRAVTIAFGAEDRARKRSLMLQAPGAPAHVMAVRIWRTINSFNLPTEGVEPPTYLAAELTPMEAQLWIDDLADSELGELLDLSQYGPVPQRVRGAALFGGCQWVITSANDRVYRSVPNNVEQFPEDAWYPVAGTGPLIALAATRTALVVYRERSVSLITPRGDGDFQVSTLTERVGASCPVVIEVPGMGLLSLSDQGPFLLSGAPEQGAPMTLTPLVEKIEVAWERVNRSALIAATGSIYRAKREVWFQVPSMGSSTPDLGFVLHYPSGRLSIREDYLDNVDGVRSPVLAMVETGDHQGNLFLGGNAGIYHVGDGYEQTRDVYYHLGPFGLPERSVVMHAELAVLGEGQHEVEVEAFINRNLTAQTEPLQKWLLNPEVGRPTYEPPPLWSNSVWDATKPWNQVVPVRVRFDLVLQSGLEHSLKIAGDQVSLSSARLILQVAATEQVMAGVEP